MTGRFIGKTYKEYQSKFIEKLQDGKEIRDFWTCQNVKKRTQAPKPFFGHLKVQKVQKVDFSDNVRNAAMYAIVFYFFSKKCHM